MLSNEEWSILTRESARTLQMRNGFRRPAKVPPTKEGGREEAQSPGLHCTALPHPAPPIPDHSPQHNILGTVVAMSPWTPPGTKIVGVSRAPAQSMIR